jgi:hypothetical protein
MIRKHYIPNLPWIELPEPALGALRIVLQSWHETPYMAGQALKGVGVDCVRFVCEVIRELEGQEEIPLVNIPADASLHNRAGAMAAFHQIISAYQPATRVSTLQPGDVLVIGPANGGPGHAMIAGPIKNTLWHSCSMGVQMTGIGFVSGYQKIFGIYRKDKSAWGRQA